MSWISRFITPTKTKAIDDKPFYEAFMARSSLKWGADFRQNLLDYLEVPEVNAIINLKARAFSSMKIEVVSKATGQPAKNNEPLVKALRHPNYFQSQKEFLFQTKLFQEIFGNEVLYFLTPVGMGSNVKGIFSLPPQFVDIKEDSHLKYWMQSEFDSRVKYHILWNGKEEPLENKDIIHINNSKVNIKEDDVFWGISQLSSLAAPISNIRASYEARNVLIENRGALGILSNDSSDTMGTVPLKDTDKEALQDEYKKYGLTKDKFQLIITGMKLKWQQMSIDADKLQLFEENKFSTEKICDSYGVPFELLSNQKGATFDNKKQARKSLYEDTIIPEAMEWIDSLNRRFETMDKSWEIVGTFDHLSVFRDNEKERAQTVHLISGALSKMFLDGAITIDEYKAELQKLKIGM